MNSIPQNLKSLTSETTFLLPGPAGELEVMLSPAPQKAAKEAIAIICHPHPLHGGTMYNKVVTTLSKTFFQLNMQTVRFNFRGVGQSTGSYGEGRGELLDLYAVLDWVKKMAPQAAIWLAGFSFGANIAIRAVMEKQSFAGLVTIAPPVNHFPLNEPVKITCPWVVVQGDKDDVVPPEAVLTWVETLNPKPVVIRFPEAGHFFHGGLTAMKEALVGELRGRVD